MKKWTILVTLLLCVTLLAGCGDTTSETKTTEDKSAATEGAATESTTTPSSAPEASAYITEEQVLQIAAEHFGIEAGTRDDKTGYLMSYQVMEIPTADAPRYKVALQWLVEVDGEPANQSVLDTVTIDAVSGDVVTDAAPMSITEDEAIAIAAEHFGIADGTVDEATGYVISYRVSQAPTEENPYYVVALQWLVTVDGEPDHQSMLDMVSIDAVSGDVLLENEE